MASLDQARAKAIKQFRTTYKAAVRRLVAYRLANPKINVLDFGYYLDGSFRESVNDTGGFNQPYQRLWEVGTIFGRTIYICEDIDWQAWDDNHGIDDPEKMDLGTYQFAITNPDVVMYHNVGMYVGTIEAKNFDKIDWNLDTIIAVTNLLNTFAHKADMARRITEFTAEFSHSAARTV